MYKYDVPLKKFIVLFFMCSFILISLNIYETSVNQNKYENFIIQLDTELNNVQVRMNQALSVNSTRHGDVHAYLNHIDTIFNRLEVLFYSAHHFLSEDIKFVTYFSTQHFGTYAKDGSLTEEEEEYLILLKEQLSYLQSVLFEDHSSMKNPISIEELNGFFESPPQFSDL
ncbi:hypothetical protein [Virgibacillus kimchii]